MRKEKENRKNGDIFKENRNKEGQNQDGKGEESKHTGREGEKKGRKLVMEGWKNGMRI